jgi:Ca2+-binding EF-hand superfamily protein
MDVLTVRAQSWEGAFRHFDQNNNNAIDGDELQQALEQFGYHLSSQLQNLLKRKYGTGLSFEHQISSVRCSCLLN